MPIGARLREERQRLGLSQTDFGMLGGVSKTTQLMYESEDRCPDANYLSAVAIKGVDVLYVVQGTRIEQAVGEQINVTLLSEILEAIETWAQQRKKSTPPSLKAELASLFYQQFSREGSANAELMSRHMRLIA